MSGAAAVPAAPPASAPRLPAPRLPGTDGRAHAVDVVGTIAEFASTLDAVRSSGRTVGFVPTMGALHEGHRALILRAAAETDLVAVSVFVNPTQFGDPGDLDGYPRTFDADLALAGSAGARIVFAPPVEEMYPERTGGSRSPGPSTTVSSSGIAERWEGASRPGHFDGVATVVVKLLAMAGRCRAYFGEKDFQQLAVVRRVVSDLSLPAVVVGCATVRDPDGLALSSRNARLSDDQRRAALALPRALRSGAERFACGEVRAAAIEAVMVGVVAAEPGVVLDYAAVVRADDLEPVRAPIGAEPIRLIVAGTVGQVRLIDNLDPRQSLTPS